MGFRSGEYGGKKISLHSIVQVSNVQMGYQRDPRTSFFFNQYTDFFGMMYTAVVQDKDTSRPRIWIGERYL
jgi:hypothetical protein